MADAPSTGDVIVGAITKLTQPGEREHKRRVKDYNHAYDVYRASAPRPASLEPWQSKLRVQYARQVIDTGLVNMVTGEPRCMVRPRHPDKELGAKAMQAVLDYYVREDHLVEKRPVVAQQGLVLGVTGGKNQWIYKTAPRQTRQFHVDPLTGGTFTQSVTNDVVERDGPCFDPLDMYYTFWDPNASDVDSARYVCCDYWVSPDEFKAQARDPETGRGLYRNVQAVLDAGDRGSKQPEQTAQERFLGGSENKRKGLIHLREVWWRNNQEIWLTVIANGAMVVRHEPSPFHHGKIPIVIAQVMPDLFEMKGISDTEAADHIQAALHTLQNMTIDNLHLTTMRGVTYREGSITDPNAIVLRPRFKWGVVDHDDIRPFEIQPLSSDIYQERQRLIGDLQLVTGVNPYVSGSDLSTVDQNTATGVTALQEVASRLLRFKTAQLHYKVYQRTYEMWGDLINQFMTQPLWVKLSVEGVEDWAMIRPEDAVGHYDYILEGSEESLSRQQERGEAIALLNAFAPLLPARPDINIKPILERVATAYDFPNPEALFQPPQQQPPAAPSQDQMFNVLGPRIGDVPQRNSYMQQGGIQMDPRLANALATIRNN